MFINALAGAIDAAHPKQFDHLSRQLWQAHAAGHIPDQDAQSLAEKLHRRRGESGVAQSALFRLASNQTPAKGQNAPAAASLRDLDAISRKLWAAHGAGAVDDDQAQRLAEMIQRRRQPLAQSPQLLIMGSTPPRYLIQRSPEQRSPDRRASILRRRGHAATGPLPPAIAAGFTTGELAVLKVLADEWLAHGACDRSLNELAARAGVCRSLAKQTIRLAELDGLIQVARRPRSGRKHLTNIIRIIRAEWLDWLCKGRRKAYAVNACNRAKPDFSISRGVQNNPPRSQDFRNANSERVDKTGEKRNRTGAGRA